MTEVEKQEFVELYKQFLRWNRMPEKLPATKDEAKMMIARTLERAEQNPYADDANALFGWIHDEPELAWELLLRIIDGASERDLSYLGTGDLETFVHIQGVRFAELIEQEIHTNPRFCEAFRWGNNERFV